MRNIWITFIKCPEVCWNRAEVFYIEGADVVQLFLLVLNTTCLNYIWLNCIFWCLLQTVSDSAPKQNEQGVYFKWQWLSEPTDCELWVGLLCRSIQRAAAAAAITGSLLRVACGSLRSVRQWEKAIGTGWLLNAEHSVALIRICSACLKWSWWCDGPFFSFIFGLKIGYDKVPSVRNLWISVFTSEVRCRIHIKESARSSVWYWGVVHSTCS
jgi:hypothetical protein